MFLNSSIKFLFNIQVIKSIDNKLDIISKNNWQNFLAKEKITNLSVWCSRSICFATGKQFSIALTMFSITLKTPESQGCSYFAKARVLC